MELKVNIGYEELLKLIQQLPKEQIAALKKELEKFIREKPVVGTNKLMELVLAGPKMSNEQWDHYQEFRAQMNNWREK